MLDKTCTHKSKSNFATIFLFVQEFGSSCSILTKPHCFPDTLSINSSHSLRLSQNTGGGRLCSKTVLTERLWKSHRVVEALGSLGATTSSRLGDLEEKGAKSSKFQKKKRRKKERWKFWESVRFFVAWFMDNGRAHCCWPLLYVALHLWHHTLHMLRHKLVPFSQSGHWCLIYLKASQRCSLHLRSWW